MCQLATDRLNPDPSAQRRAESKRKMAEFARARSEYHQQRADYWYRIQTECDNEACEIEDGETGGPR